MMRLAKSAGTFLFLVTAALVLYGQEEGKKQERKPKTEVSFKNDVFPIIKKNCLPCHAEDNFNPSELSLDSYQTLMDGGKHGRSVLPGKSRESILVQKLRSKPPFGDPMPLDPKRKRGEPSTRRLSEVEIRTIVDWIDEGARNN